MNDVVIRKGRGFNPDFDLLLWILRARGVDSNRKYLCGLCVDPDGTLVATDGVRLHSGKPTNPLPHLEAGLWAYIYSSEDVVVLEFDNDHSFPVWKEAIPTEEQLGPVFDLYDANDETTPAYKLMCEGRQAVNIRYLMDILRGGLVYKVRVSQVEARFKPIIFTRDDRMAILMPMNIPITIEAETK